ncbi:phosphotransferase [Shewanella sp. YIC-542]|uniref:phosphotransferase n=1 Tax=Shewanella mytili TaxID=3377111 RepID=UPI00398F5FAD
MYLITSATKVAPELQSEFGPLPPCFLPVGNRRLFHHQLALIPKGESVVMTLPEGFSPGKYDLDSLNQYGVKLLFLPPTLSLGESVVYALNLLEFEAGEPLFILHGDTLFDALPTTSDCLGLSQVEDNYNWAAFDRENNRLCQQHDETSPTRELIANGFFSFSSPHALVRHITQAKWDFITGLNGYMAEKGLRPVTFTHWYDFGHNHTYYQSKSRMTTQRAFNEMLITGQVVRKLSHKKQKLAAEANWYRTLPGLMRGYIPQLLATHETPTHFGYSVEYLHLTALNELYVFSQLPAFAWRKILKACSQFIQDAAQYRVKDAQTLTGLFIDKTQARLRDFSQQGYFPLNQPITFNGQLQPSLQALAQASQQALPADDGQQTLLHGDFCFSNILYDFRTCNIKVIDPRGLDNQGDQTIYGNRLYDIAKLAHSVLGLYDVIIAGYFKASYQHQHLEFTLAISARRERIMADFIQLISAEFGVSEAELYAMQIQLFLSMLPLHSDRPDRQLGFIGNAYRLYGQLLACTGNTL